MTAALRFEVQSPDFFKIPSKAIVMEEPANTGRVYFVHKDQIVAVARRSQPTDARA